MTGLNRTIPARILRVNHGGEHGAIAIYSVQIWVARWRAPDLVPFLSKALEHERSHRARFRALMPQRAAKPCRMMWVWAIGGGALGFITAVLGREAILACTQSVETTVHRHLDEQIAWATGRDEPLRQVVADIQIEEMEHIGYAVANRSGQGLIWLHRTIAAATESLIWISTRGDSSRLARQIGNALVA